MSEKTRKFKEVPSMEERKRNVKREKIRQKKRLRKKERRRGERKNKPRNLTETNYYRYNSVNYY